MINSFDFEVSEDTRNILQVWLEKGSKSLKLYIIDHIHLLYQTGLPNFSSWCIDLLVTHLYSADEEIISKVIIVLKEVCESKEMMVILISRWPQISTITHGEEFLIKFLRTTRGFLFLTEWKWVNSAMERWMDKGNEEYVEKIEHNIYKGLIGNSPPKEDAFQFTIPTSPFLNIWQNVSILSVFFIKEATYMH